VVPASRADLKGQRDGRLLIFNPETALTQGSKADKPPGARTGPPERAYPRNPHLEPIGSAR
jgi:hypothetical protein